MIISRFTTRILILGCCMSAVSVLYAQHSFQLECTLPITKDVTNEDPILGRVDYYIWGGFLDETLHKIQDGKVAIYDNDQQPLSVKQLLDKVVEVDTLYNGNSAILGIDPVTVKNINTIDQVNIEAFRMREKWLLREDGIFTKEITAYAPFVNLTLDQHDAEFLRKPLFWIHPGAVAPEHQTIHVEYWMDYKQFKNEKDSAEFKGIISAIVQALRSGVIQASICCPWTSISKSEVSEQLDGRIDTVEQINPETLQYQRAIEQHEPKEIGRIKFREQWMIDGNGNFAKRVKEYELSSESYDNVGNFRGWVPLFLVKNNVR